jgi:hypothetical protein
MHTPLDNRILISTIAIGGGPPPLLLRRRLLQWTMSWYRRAYSVQYASSLACIHGSAFSSPQIIRMSSLALTANLYRQ